MNVEEYKKNLYNNRVDNYQLIGLLKKEGSYEKISKVFKNLATHPFIKFILHSNVKPSEYKGIRASKPIPYCDNFEGEASINLLVFETHKNALNEFINLKQKFDKEIILSLYEEAEKTLDEIEIKLGKSLWSIENRVIISEYKNGTESNWEEVSNLSKQIGDQLVLFLLESYSKKAESKISYFRYHHLLKNQLENAIPLACEYICLKLDYLGIDNYDNYAYYLYADSISSLVDRYLMFKLVLSEMLTIEGRDYKPLLKFSKKLNEIFPNDVQLTQILSCLSYEYLEALPVNNKVCALLESYSKGQYDQCITIAPLLIEENPLAIEVYEIYIKSLIENGYDFKETNLGDNINTLLSILYNIYSSSELTAQSIENGLKICNTFFSTSWAKQFMSLIQSANLTSNGNKAFTLTYIINAQYINPRLLYFLEPLNVDQYYGIFNGIDSLSHTSTIIKNIVTGDYMSISKDFYITETKRDLYYGRALIRAEKYIDAKDHLEILYTKQKKNPIYYEEIIVNLYRCYIKLSQNESAVRLFVDNFLSNKASTKRLNSEKLLTSIDKNNIEELNHLIELPIFYRISTQDSYRQYVAYDTYLGGMGVTRPTEVFNQLETISDKAIYFFREVCTLEVMHHSYHFDGTEDLENERLDILNRLIVLDSAHEDLYIKEITELSQNQNIRRAIREVNKGRISVNVSQLKKNEADNIREAFNRFKEIDSYTRSKQIQGIDVSMAFSNEGLSLDDISNSKVVYSNDPSFISFKSILIEMRDKFILSKEYGLDGYLSTRIRHGTFLNHIRSIFESRNVMSQKDKANKYQDNDYWHSTTPTYLSDKIDKIQEAIKRFSSSIDEYTEYIVKELIQVKTEKYTKKPHALFDYSINTQQAAVIFTHVRENIKDYNQFLNFIFDYLKGRTDEILSNIREYINTNINEKYNVILQDFNTETKEILSGVNYPELTTAINMCSTSIQHELRNISEWFYLPETSIEIPIDLKILIQTAIQITNTIYPNYKLTPMIEERHNGLEVSGTVHMIYICRILLDNIIQHSKVPASELNVGIISNIENDNILELEFSNNLDNSVNLDALQNKLNAVKEKWENSSDYENIDIEGGSGFDKIRRIIVFDLGCKRYSFNYILEGRILSIKLSLEFQNLSL